MRATGHLLLLLLLAAVLFLVHRFSVFPHLATLADDSINYLLMAQQLAAAEPAPAIRALFGSQPYPPAFPLLLALTGGATDFTAAHTLNVLLLAGALAAVWLFVRRAGGGSAQAAAVLILFVLLPIFWRSQLGILSENLFLLLTLLTLWWVQRQEEGRAPGATMSWPQALTLAALLAAVLLTRTVGIALVAAVGFTLLAQRGVRAAADARAWVALLLPVAAHVAWFAAVREGGNDAYAWELEHRIADFLTRAGGLGGYLAGQMGALHDAFLTNLIVFWREGEIRALFASLLGLLALAGLALRLRERRLDAFYVLLSLLMLLVWPHPGQMTRFLYPLMPLLLFYAFTPLRLLEGRLEPRQRVLPPLLVTAFAAAVVVPALGFTYSRYSYPEPTGMPFHRVTEFYSEPGLERARYKALRHLMTFDDMRLIKESTPPEAVVMWFTPEFVAVLAGRRAVELPSIGEGFPYRRDILESGADFIHVSAIHPRNTGADGLSVLPYLEPFTAPVWKRQNGAELLSVLLKVDRERLREQVGGGAAAPAAPAQRPGVPGGATAD